MKRIVCLFLIPLTCLALSCNKEGDQGGTGSGNAVLGVSVTALPEIVEVPENQTQEYELFVTANPGPSAAIKVTVGTDETLVAKYNLAEGTEYEMLPSAAYEISSTPLTIMRYNKKSTAGTLKLKGAGCDLSKTYLLPLVVDQVTGTTAFEAPEENVVYVVYKMLEAQLEGAGTAASPYLIGDVQAFSKMGNVLKDGETVYVKLSADIDFAGETWTPEVSEGVYAQINASGRPIALDGDNHTVKNVVAVCPLFTNLEGSVQNLKLDNIKVEAAAEQAGLLAQASGNGEDEVVIKNVTVTGSAITNVGYTGGLIGRITKAKVENVNVACDVTGTARVGGLFGHTIACTITDCTASGDVTAESYYTGGLIGMMHSSSLKNCSASGDINHTTNSYSRVGGLVGQMFAGGTIEKCHATGNVHGGGYFGGALVGVVESLETVDGVGTVHPAIIKQSYATGSIELIRDAKDAGAGGLVGRFESGKLEVIDCYSSGSVEADRYSGAFVGDVNTGELIITNGFTNSDLSKLGPDANGNHSDGIAVGCLRTPASITIKCTGFVAWNNMPEKKFIYQDLVPSAGNYHGTEGTISQQAKALGWDETVWDLSGDVPALK